MEEEDRRERERVRVEEEDRRERERVRIEQEDQRERERVRAEEEHQQERERQRVEQEQKAEKIRQDYAQSQSVVETQNVNRLNVESNGVDVSSLPTEMNSKRTPYTVGETVDYERSEPPRGDIQINTKPVYGYTDEETPSQRLELTTATPLAPMPTPIPETPNPIISPPRKLCRICGPTLPRFPTHNFPELPSIPNIGDFGSTTFKKNHCSEKTTFQQNAQYPEIQYFYPIVPNLPPLPDLPSFNDHHKADLIQAPQLPQLPEIQYVILPEYTYPTVQFPQFPKLERLEMPTFPTYNFGAQSSGPGQPWFPPFQQQRTQPDNVVAGAAPPPQ